MFDRVLKTPLQHVKIEWYHWMLSIISYMMLFEFKPWGHQKYVYIIRINLKSTVIRLQTTLPKVPLCSAKPCKSHSKWPAIECFLVKLLASLFDFEHVLLLPAGWCRNPRNPTLESSLYSYPFITPMLSFYYILFKKIYYIYIHLEKEISIPNRLQYYYKIDSSTVIFLWILQKCLEQLLYITLQKGHP